MHILGIYRKNCIITYIEQLFGSFPKNNHCMLLQSRIFYIIVVPYYLKNLTFFL